MKLPMTHLCRLLFVLFFVFVWAGAQEVTLLEPGAEPRQELRYRPEVGMTSTTVLTQRITTSAEMDGEETPSFDLPPIRMTMTASVDEVSEAGDIHYSFAYSEVEILVEEAAGGVDSAVLQELQEGIGMLQGAGGRMVINERGVVLSAELDTPEAEPEFAALFEDLEGTFEQFATPFPEEAVGVGARWESSSTVTQGGLSIEQTSLFELTELDGDLVGLEVTMTQASGEGMLEMAPNQDIEIISLSGSGSGRYLLDLTGLFGQGNLRLTTESEMVLTEMNDEQRVTSVTTVDMTWEEEGDE
jgi:hypothetical protein